ncbi:purine permease [Rhodococcus triatomae]|uniref:Nucleobase:cation symporter-2, NCS2 family n=1 Tax=Rhodococcus triatomae TaxID=300028 RepID=A0A1G8GXE2_9NOCA|nr:nucleobase:cation symporter-2 family protein [Rhodococcus triatomae]QNG20269.1 purine permease [Rhodococcus triatomae]QNG23816.1 purine permease [Rhodococcus triatomae]SDH99095.1 nucleobase:cation symporter-2, NCS2 family [Rhodococcus triatomae]
MTRAPSADPERVHPVDQRLPVGRLFAFGLQHVLIMYAGSVTVPLVFGSAVGLERDTVAMLICASLLVAGIITVIQSLGLGKLAGARLPIVCGSTFVALTPMILIAQQYGLQAVYGSMLVGGLVGIALAWPFARIVRFFPPLVIGSVLTVVGISLIGVSGGLIMGNDPTAADHGDPLRIGLAAAVVVVALAFMCLGRGVWSQLAVLIALAAGTVVAIPLGMVGLGGVSSAAWAGFPTPFHFGAPEFPITAVVAMSIVMAVVLAETTASMLAVSEITGRRLSRGDIARGLAGDGLSGVLGGVFNASVDTVFNQNVGAVATTRVYSRYVTAVSGGILILFGAIPKVGAVIAAVPGPVVGGVGLILFSTIAVVGINTLRRAGLDDRINATIAATAVGIGLLPELAEGLFEHFPSTAQIVLGSGIALAAMVSFGLNLLFNHSPLGEFARRGTDDEPDRGHLSEPDSGTSVPAEDGSRVARSHNSRSAVR